MTAGGVYGWPRYWGEKTGGLTQAQAEDLAKKFNAVPARDKESRALYFTYEEKGKAHTVWYADELTLAFWRNIAEKYGYQRFSLWRL